MKHGKRGEARSIPGRRQSDTPFLYPDYQGDY